MNVSELPKPGAEEEYARAVAHALGYLLAIVALPALPAMAADMPWRRGAGVVAGTVVLAAALRAYLGMEVRSALSKLRAKAVLSQTDMAAFFLFVASTYTILALATLRQDAGWAAFLGIWALAALGCTVRKLTRARRTWFSQTFLSRFANSRQEPWPEAKPPNRDRGAQSGNDGRYAE